MTRRKTPSHSLEAIQKAVARGHYVVTAKVLATAARVLCDREDIAECIAQLTLDDFYKSMPSKKRPGCWQDVYRTRFGGFRVYVKLDLVQRQTDLVVVLSFKHDEAAR